MIGAVVGTQPFGGSGLSGTGPKAGGPNYLRRFATEQVVTVNTARRAATRPCWRRANKDTARRPFVLRVPEVARKHYVFVIHQRALRVQIAFSGTSPS